MLLKESIHPYIYIGRQCKNILTKTYKIEE
nr:MAG TPA: hypothetical protein [Caudoviricetes sp.]